MVPLRECAPHQSLRRPCTRSKRKRALSESPSPPRKRRNRGPALAPGRVDALLEACDSGRPPPAHAHPPVAQGPGADHTPAASVPRSPVASAVAEAVSASAAPCAGDDRVAAPAPGAPDPGPGGVAHVPEMVRRHLLATARRRRYAAGERLHAGAHWLLKGACRAARAEGPVHEAGAFCLALPPPLDAPPPASPTLVVRSPSEASTAPALPPSPRSWSACASPDCSPRSGSPAASCARDSLASDPGSSPSAVGAWSPVSPASAPDPVHRPRTRLSLRSAPTASGTSLRSPAASGHGAVLTAPAASAASGTSGTAAAGACEDAAPPAAANACATAVAAVEAVESLQWDARTYGAIVQQRIGQWEYGRSIGFGNWGVVCQGWHRADPASKCAVKVVPLNPLEDATDLSVEVDMLRRLTHPHIVALYDVVVLPHFCCLVLEMLEGGSLFDLVVRRHSAGDPLTEQEVRQYAWPIASALHHMHSLGILHRDVKLENVMLTADHRVKLVDFGLCKAIGGGTTATLCGTPQYHPPEIRRGEPYSYPFDAWGLGTTLYALATLKYPQFGTHGELAPRAWRRLACRSRGLVHLLRGLLEPEAARRLRMEQVVQHAFLATAVPADCQALYDAVAGRGGRGVRIPLLGSLYAVLRGALW